MLSWSELLLDILYAAGILALLLVLGYIAGKLARFAIIRLFNKAKIDDWFLHFSIGRAVRRTGLLPGEFFGNVASWIIYIAFALLGIYLASRALNYDEGANLSMDLLVTYIYGLTKALVVIVIGFILVDSFTSYVYKSSELRAELKLITPVVEYLRILFYIVVIIFALEQGGINVSMLTALVTPVVWSLAFVIITIIVVQLVRDVMLMKKCGEETT